MNGFRLRVVDGLAARFFYGWVIVAVGFLTLFGSGVAQSHTFGIFLGPVSAELGLTQTQWGVAFGLATLVAAFGLPFMGRLVDRHGPRRMLYWIAGSLGLSCLAFGMSSGLISLVLVFGALRFLGQGSLMLTSSNLVSRWFDRRRGFALSMSGLGFSASMGIHPPLLEWMTDVLGWRQTWLWMGISTWVMLLPLIYLLARERPAELGLRPDGATETADAPGACQTESGSLTGLTRSQAIRTSAFYIICAGMFSLSMLLTCLHLFQVSIFESHGVDRSIAARVFPVSAITAVVLVPIIGLALDRFPTHWMFAAAQMVMACSLVSVTFVESVSSAIGYALVFGLNNAFSMSLFGFIWPRYFGLRHLGSIQGIGQMIGVVGASLGALPLAVAFDLSGDYNSTLMLLAALPAGCAVLALFLRRPAVPASLNRIATSRKSVD